MRWAGRERFDLLESPRTISANSILERTEIHRPPGRTHIED